jgi:hypothetical protein
MKRKYQRQMVVRRILAIVMNQSLAANCGKERKVRVLA